MLACIHIAFVSVVCRLSSLTEQNGILFSLAKPLLLLPIFHRYKPTLKIPQLYVRRGRPLSMVVCITDTELVHTTIVVLSLVVPVYKRATGTVMLLPSTIVIVDAFNQCSGCIKPATASASVLFTICVRLQSYLPPGQRTVWVSKSRDILTAHVSIKPGEIYPYISRVSSISWSSSKEVSE